MLKWLPNNYVHTIHINKLTRVYIKIYVYAGADKPTHTHTYIYLYSVLF